MPYRDDLIHTNTRANRAKTHALAPHARYGYIHILTGMSMFSLAYLTDAGTCGQRAENR